MTTDSRRRAAACRPRRPAHFLQKALPAALALVFAPAGWAIDGGAGLPVNGQVQAGAATGSVAGNELTITQSTVRAVIDWTSFNIDAGYGVRFVQPGVTSAALNRVTGDANPSQILGSLSSNGMVMLMNPNGVMFGPNAVVNVGSLVATTGNIDAGQFMAGGNVAISGATGSIVNRGALSAQGAGLIALIAPSVVNHGSISATGGRIALAGSTAATVSLNGGLYEFAVAPGAGGVSVANLAGASLDGAQLQLSVGDAASLLTGVINLEGLQRASGSIRVDAAQVVLKSALQAPSVSGSAGQVDVHDGARIQDAVDIARAGGAHVDLRGGSYGEAVRLNKAGLTLAGHDGALLRVPDAAQANGLTIEADNVTVTGMTIAGPVTSSWLGYAWGSNISRGIVVANGVRDFTIRGNTLRDLRTGILIDGRNTGSVDTNLIDNTKAAISVQYSDGSGIAIAGNSQGANGNEWGLNLHLNGWWDGSAIRNNPIAAAPTAAWQQALLALGTANGGWAVQDLGYSTANRTEVRVAPGGLATNQGSALSPLNTIQGGINAVVAGGVVNLAGGNYLLSSGLRINKSLTLAGAGQQDSIIDARAVRGYGIEVTADHVALRDFTLYGPTADAAASYGIKVAPSGGPTARLHDFSVRDVTSRGAGRAELDLNGVDGALIERFTADGSPVANAAGSTAGAGIQITDSANIVVRDATTRNNAWGGIALYQTNRYFDQQTANVSITGGTFGELNPVFMQDESASRDFGALDIAGFGFAVRNGGSLNASSQYTWLQATRQQALDYAVNLPGADASYVQGWNGSAATQDFQVGFGSLAGGGNSALRIGTALDHADNGANIHVASGAYGENLVLARPYNLHFDDSTVHSLRLESGAAGSGLAGRLTADGTAGLRFEAPVQLLGDTVLATHGADIVLAGDVRNAGAVPRSLSLRAGSGANRGDVQLLSGGTEADPLGVLDVLADNVNLSGTLWVGRYGIDALGNVALSASTLRSQWAGAANTLAAGGNVTGSTISEGDVSFSSGGDIAGTIRGANVSLQALGDLNVTVAAQGLASLAGDSVVASVVAPQVDVHASGEALISGAAAQITVDAPGGSLNGSFGQVNNTGSGLLNINGRPQGNRQLSDNSENNRVIRTSGELSADTDAGTAALPQGTEVLALAGEAVGLSRPEAAGQALARGEAVEIDLSPGREERDKP